MTLHIPDELARGLEGIAAAQKKTVNELALEHLRGLVERPTSPRAVLAAIQALPHPSADAVDELEAAIASSKISVRDQPLFDL